MLPLVRQLPNSAVYVSARAPLPFEWGGATWHGISEDIRPDPKTFGESFEILKSFLAALPVAYPVDPARLYLLGFSMGAGMSVATALHNPSLVAGVAALSGYLPEDVGISYDWPGVAGKPFFVAHGSDDPLVPTDRGRALSKALSDAGADVAYHEYPMGHSISDEELQDLVAWLSPRLQANPAP